MTDNRANEPTEAQVEAAAKAMHGSRNPWFAAYGRWDDAGFELKQAFRKAARAALEAAARAAQGAAPQAEPPNNRENCPGSGGHAGCGEFCSMCYLTASMLPPRGVDEDALARILCEKNYRSPDGEPTCAACRDKAHEVAEWLDK